MDLAEISRLLENLLRLGKIAEVQHASPPRVRVQTGGLTSDWLPWIEQRAGGTRTWSPPTVGEQVLMLCPSGELRNGIVLCGIPSDDIDVPSNSATETVTQYADGAVARYDHAASAMFVTGIKSLVVEAGTSVLVKSPDIKLDGNVTVTGLLSYQSGIAGEGGSHGNLIRGDVTHEGGKMSSNGVVVDDHDHGAVKRGEDWTEGTR
ncbi:phage baseplate assembly protein V [Cupriavidus plantarum]|uniref:phage baseplate assembly protein V n=1 Tax=Cupriavidus plantarum TaxID=942865 RepID=UPI000E22B7EF|nr:phage baseplate assembly protein V [Cupriavidus plantarum]REE92640.1 phage baseplate assembly protein V [Cupriavidus plantarum]